MPAVMATATTISPEFVARLAERAQDAERVRQLPAATIDDLLASGFTELLVPARYGGRQAAFPAILDPVRRMAHGCASSAWTIGFYTLHNWMLALFDERAQEEAFAPRPFLAPAPLAPTGPGRPTDDGVRLTGRWSWATGVMHGNRIIVGALCGPDEAIYPALALLPAGDFQIEDIWHTDGMRATGSNDVVITDVFLPEHRLVRVSDIYTGTTPGAGLHHADTYRWPMVPALALLAAIRALRGLLADTVGAIETVVAAGEPVPRPARGEARLAAVAHIVHESRAVIGCLLEASGALSRPPGAADQPRRRRDLRSRGVRLPHQPRTPGGVHTGYEGATDRNGVKGLSMANELRDRITNTFQKHVANPLMRLMPFQTLLETTGRSSGEPRRTPLGGSRVGDQFWFVSEFGEKSQYVKNIKANPNVRVRLNGRWHNGVAHLLPDDDPHARLRELPQFNSFGVRTFGTNLLTIRVDFTD